MKLNIDALYYKVMFWLYYKCIDYYTYNMTEELWEDLTESGAISDEMLVKELTIDIKYTANNLQPDEQDLILELARRIKIRSDYND